MALVIFCAVVHAGETRSYAFKEANRALIDGGAIASARATIGITAAYRAKLLRLEFSCQKKRAPATKKRDGGSGAAEEGAGGGGGGGVEGVGKSLLPAGFQRLARRLPGGFEKREGWGARQAESKGCGAAGVGRPCRTRLIIFINH